MPRDINSAIGQAENANAKLAEYFSDLSKFLQGLGALPDFNDFISTFDFSELHRIALLRSGDSASYENGAAIENIHSMVGINREFGLRQKNKIEYYADASSEARTESDLYATAKVFWVNMLSGIYIEGESS